MARVTVCLLTGWFCCLIQAAESFPLPASSAAAIVKTPSLAELGKRVADLLKRGESALSRLDAQAADEAFEQASFMAHSADIEMGLVRSYMQAGDYRKALAFAAHTAGAHREEPEGTALYAWLLHIGGQREIAKRLLVEAINRTPQSAQLRQVSTQLTAREPLAATNLLRPPGRLAPYGETISAQNVRVVSSGLLLSDGLHVLAPVAFLVSGQKVWVRNGLGAVRSTRVVKKDTALGLVLLAMDKALPVPSHYSIASGPVFPGSVGLTVDYFASPKPQTAWPMLHAGFLEAVNGKTVDLALRTEMPSGTQGGPVFDIAGRLIGVTSPKVSTKVNLLIAYRQIAAFSGALWEPASGASRLPPASLDEIYEGSLKTALQVLVSD